MARSRKTARPLQTVREGAPTEPRTLSGPSARITASAIDNTLTSFAQGESELNGLAWRYGDVGSELGVQVHEEIVNALLADQVPSVASRMVAEVAGSGYIDWAIATRLARGLEEQCSDPAALREIERFHRRADRCARRMLAALEMLRRPEPRSVRVTVTAENLNVAQQQQVISPSTNGGGSTES